jgi:hypothetical protein
MVNNKKSRKLGLASSAQAAWDFSVAWHNRVATGLPTHAATAREAHVRLMLTKAINLSAKLK